MLSFDRQNIIDQEFISFIRMDVLEKYKIWMVGMKMLWPREEESSGASELTMINKNNFEKLELGYQVNYINNLLKNE